MEKVRLKKFIPAILALACLVALWIVCPICFQNNDDKVIMYLTAGYTTGKPELGTVFGGFLWSGFIGLFYRVYSGIAWYTVLTLIVIAISLIVVFYSFTKAGAKSWFGILLFVSIFMYFVAALQYTVTAAIVGCAGICALIVYLLFDDRKRWFVISIALLVCSFSIRKQIGWVTLSAMLIIGFIQFIKAIKDKKVKTVLIAGIIIVSAFLLTYITNAIYEKASGISAFNDYYAEAGDWIDYPHLDIEEDTDGIYKSVGWDKPLYDAATRWYFMDERLTTENFAVVKTGYSADSLTVKEYIKRTIDLMQSSPICNVQFIMWIVMLLIVNVLAIVKKRFNASVLTADCLFLFCMLVIAYFCIWQGRFPMRVYEALIIIYMVPSVLLLVSYDIIMTVIQVLFLAATLVVFPQGNMLKATYEKTHDGGRAEEVAQTESLENYAIDNSNNIYVYDYELSLPADPFTTYTNAVPKNVLFWGGWTYNTPMYYSQLKANGRDSIYAKDFIDGSIYLCGRYVDDTIVTYMQSLYPDAEPVVANEFDGMVIYQFTREN